MELDNILEFKDFSLYFSKQDKEYQGLFNLDFTLRRGETLGIIGESGSGKTQTAMSILRLSPENSRHTGSIFFRGKDIYKYSEEEMNKIRGNYISIALQDTSLCMNPYLKVRDQLIEPLIVHYGKSEVDAEKEVLRILDCLKIPDAKKRINSYPHEFSGGQRQRFLIAMALVCKPAIFIADELTTSLDVVTQKDVLQYLKDVQKKTDMSILFISHDLRMLSSFVDRIIVMYCGHIVEESNVKDFFSNPLHPYSKGLLDLLPKISDKGKLLKTINGEISQLTDLPKGCPFSPRCERCIEKCYYFKPKKENIDGRNVCCFNINDKTD